MAGKHMGQLTREGLPVIADSIKSQLPEGALFALFVFTDDPVEGGTTHHYIATARRKDVLDNLERYMEHLRGKPTPPRS